MKSTLALLVFALLGTPALAQSDPHGGPRGHSPYAGLEQREIKALSNEQIADLRAGRGMSLALPAEVNGYPGPRHVLELADALNLTPDQRASTQSLFAEMEREAMGLGARVIESERLLDTLFADGVGTPETLAAATTEAASLQGQLRAIHLKYHLDMKAMLTPEQVMRYNDLRGYRGSSRPL
ncbi:MAG TPA: periplasmic heavy metal sensor [Casimicrobiaceae bacterium]|nr:periplasmic heavy metal sensor [Casimicrobiaceae bacterium]